MDGANQHIVAQLQEIDQYISEGNHQGGTGYRSRALSSGNMSPINGINSSEIRKIRGASLKNIPITGVPLPNSLENQVLINPSKDPYGGSEHQNSIKMLNPNSPKNIIGQELL